MVWECVCVCVCVCACVRACVCVCVWTEWTWSMHYVGISTYEFSFRTMPASAIHTNTRILKPFEDNEPTGLEVDITKSLLPTVYGLAPFVNNTSNTAQNNSVKTKLSGQHSLITLARASRACSALLNIHKYSTKHTLAKVPDTGLSLIGVTTKTWQSDVKKRPVCSVIEQLTLRERLKFKWFIWLEQVLISTNTIHKTNVRKSMEMHSKSRKSIRL